MALEKGWIRPLALQELHGLQTGKPFPHITIQTSLLTRENLEPLLPLKIFGEDPILVQTTILMTFIFSLAMFMRLQFLKHPPGYQDWPAFFSLG